MRLAPEGEFSNFVEGLGPGQIVGRQALASPNLGDIQLSLCDRKGNLEVEVIRARGLIAKPGAKLLPGIKCLPKDVDLIFKYLFSQRLMSKYTWSKKENVSQKQRRLPPEELSTRYINNSYYSQMTTEDVLFRYLSFAFKY